MLSLLSSIANTIVSLVQLVISTIDSFVNLLLEFPTYITFLSTSIGFLPDLVVPFALATISIIVVLFMIGR